MTGDGRSRRIAHSQNKHFPVYNDGYYKEMEATFLYRNRHRAQHGENTKTKKKNANTTYHVQ